MEMIGGHHDPNGVGAHDVGGIGATALLGPVEGLSHDVGGNGAVTAADPIGVPAQDLGPVSLRERAEAMDAPNVFSLPSGTIIFWVGGRCIEAGMLICTLADDVGITVGPGMLIGTFAQDPIGDIALVTRDEESGARATSAAAMFATGFRVLLGLHQNMLQ